MTDLYPVRRALLSVSDKTGLIELGRALAGKGLSFCPRAAPPKRCAMRVWT